MKGPKSAYSERILKKRFFDTFPKSILTFMLLLSAIFTVKQLVDGLRAVSLCVTYNFYGDTHLCPKRGILFPLVTTFCIVVIEIPLAALNRY